MAEPFLDEVEGDAGGDGGDAEAVAQAFGRGVRPVEPGGFHDGVDGAPAGHPAPGPEAHAAAFAAPGLQLADAVHHVERFEQGRGHGHGAIDAGAALLQALEHQHAGGEIDAIGGEREGLGEPAPGIGQRHAEGPHLAVGELGLAQEGVALAGGEVFPRAVGGVQLHPDLGRGRGGVLRDAGSRAGGALAGARGQRPAFLPSACRWSPGPILVAAAPFGAEEGGEGVDGGAGVGIGVEAAAALGSDAAPLADEEGAAEEVGPDFHAVVAPFAVFGPDADERGGFGEQRELDGLGPARALVCGVWAWIRGKCIAGGVGVPAESAAGRGFGWVCDTLLAIVYHAVTKEVAPQPSRQETNKGRPKEWTVTGESTGQFALERQTHAVTAHGRAGKEEVLELQPLRDGAANILATRRARAQMAVAG